MSPGPLQNQGKAWGFFTAKHSSLAVYSLPLGVISHSFFSFVISHSFFFIQRHKILPCRVSEFLKFTFLGGKWVIESVHDCTICSSHSWVRRGKLARSVIILTWDQSCGLTGMKLMRKSWWVQHAPLGPNANVTRVYSQSVCFRSSLFMMARNNSFTWNFEHCYV